MASSQTRRVIKIGSSRYPVEGSFGSYSAGGVQAMTLDGLHEKLSRQARQKVEAKGKASMRRGNSKPDGPTGTGRKWFS